MSIVKPYTFVAGNKARANEVNANFDLLFQQVNANITEITQNALDIEELDSNKANINGSSTQRFAVADPISNGDAVNKQSLMRAIGNTIDMIYGLGITKDSGSPNDTILVYTGACYDSTKSTVLSLTVNTSKQNLNQGANATYYVYIIGNSSGSSIDILISSESVEPSLPSGYTLYRQIGSYTTNSSSEISGINSLSSSYSEGKTFVTDTRALGSGTTDLSSVIPNDGNIYFIWVYNVLDASWEDTGISTDIFPYTVFNKLDNDAGRRSQSAGLVCVPVGNGRYVYVNRGSTLRGYMKA